MFHQLLSNWFPHQHMFNLGRLQSCLENNVWDSSLTDVFSFFFFFVCVFFFHWGCAKYQSWDDRSVIYRRGCDYGHSHRSRHTAPLYSHKLSHKITLFVFAVSEPKYLKHKRKSTKASILFFYFFFPFFLFFPVLWCQLGQLPVWQEAFLEALGWSETQYLTQLPCKQYSCVTVLMLI